MQCADESHKEFVSILLAMTFELRQLPGYATLELERIYGTICAAPVELVKEFHNAFVDWIALFNFNCTMWQRLPYFPQLCYKLTEGAESLHCRIQIARVADVRNATGTFVS